MFAIPFSNKTNTSSPLRIILVTIDDDVFFLLELPLLVLKMCTQYILCKSVSSITTYIAIRKVFQQYFMCLL